MSEMAASTAADGYLDGRSEGSMGPQDWINAALALLVEWKSPEVLKVLKVHKAL